MDSDIFKIGLCAGLAVFCFTAPEWAPAVAGLAGPSSPEGRTPSGYAEADALRSYEHPEDEWCSGATPDCPSHWEVWDLGFTNYEVENTLPPTTEE